MKKDNRNNVIGGKHRATNRYELILYRIKNTHLKKNRHYEGVRMLIDKDVFVKWFMENDFEGASVDRIDKSKDYTMDNIQLIPLVENVRKDKVKAKNGYCECFRCKQVKPLELFAKDKRRQNGHSTICMKCDVERKKHHNSTGTK